MRTMLGSANRNRKFLKMEKVYTSFIPAVKCVGGRGEGMCPQFIEEPQTCTFFIY